MVGGLVVVGSGLLLGLLRVADALARVVQQLLLVQFLQDVVQAVLHHVVALAPVIGLLLGTFLELTKLGNAPLS